MREDKAPRARAGEVLVGAPLDEGDVDARQCQLARQHQPCRTCAGDHHRVLGHRSLLAWKQATDSTALGLDNHCEHRGSSDSVGAIASGSLVGWWADIEAQQ